MKLLSPVSLFACALVIAASITTDAPQASAAQAAANSNTPAQEATADGTATGLSGNWQISWTGRDGNPKEATMQIQQDGSKLSGTFQAERGSAPLTGSLRGNQVSLSVDARGRELSFTGTLNGDKMTGTTKRGKSWTASRQ